MPLEAHAPYHPSFPANGMNDRGSWILDRVGSREQDLLLDDRRMSVAGTSTNPCVMAIRAASGIRVEDETGRRYIDLYGNNCHHIGYRHPRLIEALRRQLDAVPFVARGFTSELSIAFAAMLRQAAELPDAKVVSARSGADAIEIALATARAATGRYKTISFYDSYHGRSAGALSIGGRYQDQLGLGPMLPGNIRIPPYHRHQAAPPADDHAACARLSLQVLRTVFEHERDIAAVVGETIRNNPFVPPHWYWPEVRELCNRHGTLLILDEIATGLGKTGSLFNFHRFGIRPDIVCVGKALGGTLAPLSAVLVNGDLALDPGLNIGYYTHDKNPFCAQAGLSTLGIIADERLVENARTLGAHAACRLDELRVSTDRIQEVRAAGLMLAIEFAGTDAAAIAERVYRTCIDAGVIPTFPRGAVLTLSAPLVITRPELDSALDTVAAAVRLTLSS